MRAATGEVPGPVSRRCDSRPAGVARAGLRGEQLLRELIARVVRRIGLLRHGAAEETTKRLPAVPRIEYQQSPGRDRCLHALVVFPVDADGVGALAVATAEGGAE